MADTTSNDPPPKTRKGPGGRIKAAFAVVAGLALATGLYNSYASSEGSGTQEETSSEGTVRYTGDTSSASSASSNVQEVALQEQSTCPPFGRRRNTCEVRADDCSGWIPEGPGLPAGLTHWFMPAADEPETPEDRRVYRTIHYIGSDGEQHLWRHGETPSGVTAWNFCPRRTIRMSYYAT